MIYTAHIKVEGLLQMDALLSLEQGRTRAVKTLKSITPDERSVNSTAEILYKKKEEKLC